MDRLVQSVRQHVQFRRHFRHAPRPIEQLLRLFQHWSFQHRRRTVARLGRVEPLGAVVPIHLHIPLHRDHRHAKRLDDLFGFHRPAGNHLAGEHAETPYVLLLVLEHRQVAVEIKHPARLSLYGDLAVDLRHPGRKNRQLKLRDPSLLPQLPPAPQVRLGIIPFSLPGKKHGARSGDLNVQIHHVISDITGLTGLAIVDAIVGGQRDPLELAKLRDPHIKASEETIRKSLVGNWRGEHLFTLKQSRQMYQHYQEQLAACDEEIEKLLVAFQTWVDPEEKPLPPDRKKKQRGRKKKNVNPKTGFDLRTESYKLFGVDLTQGPGLMGMILTLFGEVGRDMSRWPTSGNFVSWLALCPDNDITGGRVVWKGMRTVHNRAGGLFRLAAYSLHHDQSQLGDYLRRMKSKMDAPAATTATAHKDRDHLLHDGEEASR